MKVKKRKNKGLGNVAIAAKPTISMANFPPIIDERLGKDDGKNYLKKITILWSESGELPYKNYVLKTEKEFFELITKIYDSSIKEYIDRGYNPYEPSGYTKTKINFQFEHGEEEVIRFDVAYNEGDFNPYRYISIQAYANIFRDNYYQKYIFRFRNNPNYENPLFKKEVILPLKPKKDEKKEDKGYSGNKRVGSKYKENAGKSLKEIAVMLRADFKQELPQFKVGVRIDGNSIIAILKETNYNPFTNEFIDWIKSGKTESEFYTQRERTYNSINVFNKQFLKHLENAKAIHYAYNYNDSDAMTDYFNVGYYGSVEYNTEQLISQWLGDYLPKKVKTAREIEYEQRIAKREEKVKEFKNALKFKRFDVVEYGVNWRGKGLVREICIITKVPNGRARFSSYDLAVIREVSEEKVSTLKKFDTKTRPNLYYINGKPYGRYHYIENVYEEKIEPTTVSWSNQFYSQNQLPNDKPNFDLKLLKAKLELEMLLAGI